MFDNSVIEQTDTATLIAAAVECSRQQAEILSVTEALSEADVERLQELERVRAKVVRLIDWSAIDDVTPYAESLQLLQRLDEENRLALTARRDELADRIKLLRKRRDVAGAYMNSR